jgi:hypothetical protein
MRRDSLQGGRNCQGCLAYRDQASNLQSKLDMEVQAAEKQLKAVEPPSLHHALTTQVLGAGIDV